MCKRDFTTLYRAYLTQATPQDVLRKTSNIWAAYFDSGTLTVARGESVAGDEPVKLEMLELETTYTVYAMMMHAYLEQLMVMAGAKTCTIQRSRERLLYGKLSCEFLVDFGV